MQFPAKFSTFARHVISNQGGSIYRPSIAANKHLASRTYALALSILVITSLLLPPPVAHADFSRPIDIVSVTWPKAPSLTTSLTTARKEVQNYTIPYWLSHAGIQFSRGMDSSAPLMMPSEAPCNGDATVNYMNAVASKFYTSQGLNAGNRYLIILTPTLSKNCVWQAKSIVGDFRISFGITILQNNASPLVITHELGHALGLGHTNLMNCPTPTDSEWSSCQNLEYAGGVDIMSNIENLAPLNIYHLWRLGKIDSSDIKSISQSDTFSLNPIGNTPGLRGIFIHDGDAIYWIEYRAAFGGMKAGLTVYRTDSPNGAAMSSPNPEYTGHYLGDTSGDVWLLNLDNYKYSAKPTGSPSTWNFTTVSGNVNVSATESAGQAIVNVHVNDSSRLTPMPPSPPDLSQYGFSTNDFGSLYEIEPVDNSNSLQDPTLQLCNGVFPSEMHRKFRYQATANPIRTSKYSFISSEVVQYESAAWASAALKEIDAAMSKCSPKIARIKYVNSIDAKSLTSREILSTQGSAKNAQNLFASFHIKGDKMVGVYVISTYSFGQNEINRWEKLANKVGSRL